MTKIPYFSIFIFCYSYVLFHRLGWQVKLPKMGKFRLAFIVCHNSELIPQILTLDDSVVLLVLIVTGYNNYSYEY